MCGRTYLYKNTPDTILHLAGVGIGLY